MAKRKNSVQKLIGFERFTKYGVRTDKCEYAFFIVEPTNISVMSQASIDTKIYHLRMLLSIVPDLEVIAMDNCECFDSNKLNVRRRLNTERNESIRRLLQADFDFLDEIQLEMSSARQFLFCVRFRKEKEEQVFHRINEIAKQIRNQGFVARNMDKGDIKHMLALYFGSSITGENIDDVEGCSYFERKDACNEEKETVES